MYYKSKSVVFGRAFMNRILAALSAAPLAEIIDTPKVRLSGDPAFNPQPNSVAATLALTEVAVSGYTAGGYVVVPSAPVNISDSIRAVVADVLIICATADPLLTDVAYGYWLEDVDGFVLGEKFAGTFTAPFGIVGDFLHLDLVIPVNSLQLSE